MYVVYIWCCYRLDLGPQVLLIKLTSCIGSYWALWIYLLTGGFKDYILVKSGVHYSVYVPTVYLQ